ncbi:Hypothetical_protein [Hexamita inflata]|uniref:Hypothetical_protein n=1 Tax=Hexamita inflata TaxID=28002 RepID=A0AA86NJ87_9EUKA|nr:Hypothetical protein HINF_LOCUS7978 [Hexamita inflata]
MESLVPPTIPQFDQKRFEQLIADLNSYLYKAVQQISEQKKQFSHDSVLSADAVRFVSWRNYLLSCYNLELLQLIKLRTSPAQQVDSIKQHVDALLLLQLKLNKLILLEESQTQQLSQLIRAANQQNEPEQTAKVVKTKTDLFDDEELDTDKKVENFLKPVEDQLDTRTNLEDIKSTQQVQRSINRLKNSKAAGELFQAETEMPMEYQLGEQQNKEVQDYEDENMTRLSKTQKKKYQKRNENQDGLMENDILDGIGQVGQGAKRAFGKKDKK